MQLNARSDLGRHCIAVGLLFAVGLVPLPAQDSSERELPSTEWKVFADREAALHAYNAWRKLVRTCAVQRPDSKSPGLSSFYLSQSSQKLYEFREPRPAVLPEPITPADQLNQIEWHGFAVLGESASRIMDATPLSLHEWSKWADSNTPESAADARQQLVDGAAPLLILRMEKRGGHWLVGWPEPPEFTIIGEIDLNQIAANRVSCAAVIHENQNPFHEADSKLREQLETQAQERDQEMKAQQQEREKQMMEAAINRYSDFGDALLCKGTHVRSSVGEE